VSFSTSGDRSSRKIHLEKWQFPLGNRKSVVSSVYETEKIVKFPCFLAVFDPFVYLNSNFHPAMAKTLLFCFSLGKWEKKGYLFSNLIASIGEKDTFSRFPPK